MKRDEGGIMSEAHIQYKDSGEFIEAFMAEIWVTCPQCQSYAHVLPLVTETTQDVGQFSPRKLICVQCGLTRTWSKRGLGIAWFNDPVRDPYFDLPLWLQITCCGHVLWALNPRHLKLIEDYISADLRIGYRDENGSYRNSSLANRLPEWMIVAKHRTPVLKAVRKLKDKQGARNP